MPEPTPFDRGMRTEIGAMAAGIAEKSFTLSPSILVRRAEALLRVARRLERVGVSRA